LSTAEVARALLVPEATMAKRLTRAKQKIAQAHIPYRVPATEELPSRLAGVASTVYLIFNEGYTGRVQLLAEAVRLARLLAELMPDEPTALGLLALVLLQDARRGARFDSSGLPVLLSSQDRAQWDPSLIKEGVALVGVGLRRTPSVPNPYVVQAAIAACHDLAPSYEETNWDAVISWYDVLLSAQDTAVVRLNRAAAVAERDGPAAGLALVDSLPGLAEYPWWHASRAELLHRLGSPAASAALERAVETGLPDAHVAHLRRRLGPQ
jgi:RNA polymerase sigma-70 factor (ECF subfamily)